MKSVVLFTPWFLPNGLISLLYQYEALPHDQGEHGYNTSVHNRHQPWQFVCSFHCIPTRRALAVGEPTPSSLLLFGKFIFTSNCEDSDRTNVFVNDGNMCKLSHVSCCNGLTKSIKVKKTCNSWYLTKAFNDENDTRVTSKKERSTTGLQQRGYLRGESVWSNDKSVESSNPRCF